MSVVKSNLHTHTVYSDGQSKLEDYVLAALEKGFVSLGFSEHNYTPYDGACCVKQEQMAAYYREVRALQQKYSGQLEIYLGLEGDFYYPTPLEEIDYWIGSVHYLRDDSTGIYYTIDHLPEIFQKAVERVTGGSVQQLVELYYDLVRDLVCNQRPDIIGHLDLITKLNGDNKFFDTSANWYHTAVSETIDAIAGSNAIVEVNTGGIYRGYKEAPYPGLEILQELHQRKVPVTISSDAHHTDGLDFWFEQAKDLLLEAGYRSIMRMQQGAFQEVALQ